ERGDGPWRRREPQRERSRGGHAMRPDEAPVVAPRLGAGDPLLEHGRQERLPDRAGPAEHDAPAPAGALGDHGVPGGAEAGRVVARAALIASLALIVVPGPVGSRVPSAPGAIDPSKFGSVELGYAMTTMTTSPLDPDTASAGRLELDAILREPAPAFGELAPRP